LPSPSKVYAQTKNTTVAIKPDDRDRVLLMGFLFKLLAGFHPSKKNQARNNYYTVNNSKSSHFSA